MAENTGILYLCATPIGNLEDMTFRAIRILKEAAVIAAEDTRHTRKLLSHFDIHIPLISYHEHNKVQMGEKLLARLLAGEDVALVSDAGLPGVSDPGMDLVRLAINNNIRIVPIPGPNAALSALICSGLDTSIFTFAGFLPKKNAKRQEFLGAFRNYSYTIVLYESPHRLTATLEELLENWGNRQIVVGRELTKKFEEFRRSDIKTMLNHFMLNPAKGEITIVIEGQQQELPVMNLGSEVSLAQAVKEFENKGLSGKDAMRQVALTRNVSRRSVYQACLEWEKKKEV